MTIRIISDRSFNADAIVGRPALLAGTILSLDYENSDFYVDGHYYFSKADMVTAGFYTIDATNGDRLDITGLVPSAYTIFATGTSGATNPNGTTSRYLCAIDDGEDASAGDDIAFLSQAASSPYVMSVGVFRASTGEGVVSSATGVPINTEVRVAARIVANDVNLSHNGNIAIHDATATLPTLNRLIIGNRGIDYARPWVGTVKKVQIIGSAYNDSALQALTA